MTSRIRAMFVAAIVSLGFAVGAQAANVVGSSGLLNASDANQIETWLGQGSVQFDNVFTKVSGSTSTDFHAAADGKGATISIFSVAYGNGSQALIGGYNPSSWNAGLSNYNYTFAGGAFLFNLTSGLVQQQRAGMPYQTYNNVTYGPTFGGGVDLYATTVVSG
ncbi:MAG: PEP_CTERM-anchored TLD domain-containing protein [Burkholderiales bacterium]|nr:PEP_CTERM-anchored TLD domain-containing protein [Burkholderiales bacterium]